MAKNVKYPIVAPRRLIQAINEIILDGVDPEEFLPGVMKALYRLNKSVLVHPPKTLADDEGFASWVYNFDMNTGEFWVSSDQPHYVKGPKKSFVYDGKNFV